MWQSWRRICDKAWQTWGPSKSMALRRVLPLFFPWRQVNSMVQWHGFQCPRVSLSSWAVYYTAWPLDIQFLVRRLLATRVRHCWQILLETAREEQRGAMESFCLSRRLAAVSGISIFKTYLELWAHFPSQSWQCRTCTHLGLLWTVMQDFMSKNGCSERPFRGPSERLQLSWSHQKGNKCRPPDRNLGSSCCCYCC